PSKTFLLGDYLSLLGGPALLLNTEPRFQGLLESIQPTVKSSAIADKIQAIEPYPGIHPQSPAGKFLQRHASDFADCNLTFFDPHQGAGGFGASSAQFLMVYALWSLKTSRWPDN